MRIYTKTGDKGETSLYGGRRVVKTDERVEAYGTLDELSSFIGLTASRLDESKGEDRKSKIFLIGIQEDIWKMMAVLSGAKPDLSYLPKRTAAFEKKIDAIQNKLPKLKRFILPGGTELSSLFHVCRAVCRRAERRVVVLLSSHPTIENLKSTVIYLNRLSDLFFMFARNASQGKEIVT